MADDSDRYRRLLERQLDELRREAIAERDELSVVALDQQSVGRLSRMDAMQRQAMAQAADRRRRTTIRRTEAALERIEDGEFGWCDACGETIAPRRLELDPTVTRCVECASG